MFESKYFKTEELVSSNVYNLLGDNAISLFHDKFLETIDLIREELGYYMVCNNYSFKDFKNMSQFNYRGFREKTCLVGSKSGAHYKGLAGDFDFYNKNWERQKPSKIIDEIIENKDKFPKLAGLELGVNWVHIDCMQECNSDRRKGIKDGNVLLFYSSRKLGESRVV